MSIVDLDDARQVSTGTFDAVLINLDIGWPGAILRVALGFLLLPTLESWVPAPGRWTVVGSLLVMLLGLKGAAAIARRVVPVSAVVRSHWEWRRELARHHDSYQWRKLVWIGVGLLAGAAVGSSDATIQWMLGAVCVLAGGVAEVFWRRQGLRISPPAGP
jgi:hypothetical protein